MRAEQQVGLFVKGRGLQFRVICFNLKYEGGGGICCETNPVLVG